MSETIQWLKVSGQSITTNSHAFTIDKAISLGWERQKVNPDKGFGVVNSIEWHTNSVQVMDDKAEIRDYVKEFSDVDIGIKGTLKALKAKAIKTIKEAK